MNNGEWVTQVRCNTEANFAYYSYEIRIIWKREGDTLAFEVRLFDNHDSKSGDAEYMGDWRFQINKWANNLKLTSQATGERITKTDLANLQSRIILLLQGDN